MTITEFKEVQGFKTWWVWLGIVIFSLFFLFFLVSQIVFNKPIGENPVPVIVLVIGLVFFAGILFFLWSLKLTTWYSDEGIRYKFSPFHRKERVIEWHELKDAYMRDYNSFYEYGGWGIRLGGKAGNAINTSASSRTGLQLKFNNGKLLLIGTAKPEAVGKIIEQIMSSGKINRGV